MRSPANRRRTADARQAALGTGVYPFGNVVGCALRQELEARALRGDLAAIRILLAAVPRDLPLAVVMAWRDRQIAAIAGDLQAATGLPAWSIACLLAELGEAVDLGFRPPAPACLTAEEFAELVGRLGNVISALPRRRGGRRWISSKQILRAFLVDNKPG